MRAFTLQTVVSYDAKTGHHTLQSPDTGTVTLDLYADGNVWLVQAGWDSVLVPLEISLELCEMAFGFNQAAATSETADAYFIEVTTVHPDTAAARSGLKEGDKIISVNGVTGTAKQMKRVSQGKRKLELLVVRVVEVSEGSKGSAPLPPSLPPIPAAQEGGMESTNLPAHPPVLQRQVKAMSRAKFGRNTYVVTPNSGAQVQEVIGFAEVMKIIGTLPASQRRGSMTVHTAQIKVREAGPAGLELNGHRVHLQAAPTDKGKTITLQHLLAERSMERRNVVPEIAPANSITSTGVVWSTSPMTTNNGPMTLVPLQHGYQYVRLEMRTGTVRAYFVLLHRLVLTVHAEPYPAEIPDAQCDHIDGNTANNDVRNLQWLSPRDHQAKTNHIPTDAQPAWNGDGTGWWYRRFWYGQER